MAKFPSNVALAVKALKAIDAPVYDHLRGEHGCEFIIGAELRTNDDKLVCDYYQETIKERVVSGKVINAFGIDQRIHVILARYGLRAEWVNPGQVAVYSK